MGGRGSGFQGRAKTLTNERLRLDVGKLAKGGVLTPGTRAVVSWKGGSCLDLKAEAATVVLSYCQDLTNRRDCIGLDWVPCRFGGSRVWFRCPWCNRRCGGLYASTSGFCCHKCADLNYQATREDPRYLHMRRADRIRARLGWTPGIAFGPGERPKGMHRQTFARLLDEYNRHEAAHWGLWGAFLDAQQARLQRVRDAWPKG